MAATPGERVLVTGACGGLGSVVVEELLRHGYEVTGIDKTVKSGMPVRVIAGNLTSASDVAYAMRGCAAVIHLGAYPSPYGRPDDEVFGNNTGATFAVLQAASLLGVKRAAIASSVSAYGNAWAPEPFPPLYLPIDEAQPMLNHDAYGLSKEVDEITARMFVRREGMSVAALRFHWIVLPGMLSQSVAPRTTDPAGIRTMWGYVKVEDAARACRLAIETARDAPFGFEAFNIVADDTLALEETEILVRRIAPDVEIRHPLPGFTSGYDNSKAKRLLGWHPGASWRDDLD